MWINPVFVKSIFLLLRWVCLAAKVLGKSRYLKVLWWTRARQQIFISSYREEKFTMHSEFSIISEYRTQPNRTRNSNFLGFCKPFSRWHGNRPVYPFWQRIFRSLATILAFLHTGNSPEFYDTFSCRDKSGNYIPPKSYF